MSGLTTHILDLERGRPARGVPVRLEHRTSRGWEKIAERETDEDGRTGDLLAGAAKLETGRYRITFETGEYFRVRSETAFYPEVTVAFEVDDAAQHYHVPLLLSPFGYSTYRGS